MKTNKTLRFIFIALAIFALALSSIACEDGGTVEDVVSGEVSDGLGDAFDNNVKVSTDGRCYDTGGIVAVEVQCP